MRRARDLIRKRKELASGASTRVLADKLHDLELIYSKFESALTGKYLDANDYLSLLAESISKSDYLRDAEIYIDGFHNFTPQEHMVIDNS